MPFLEVFLRCLLDIPQWLSLLASPNVQDSTPIDCLGVLSEIWGKSRKVRALMRVPDLHLAT
eukprot:m.236673 g.236673  ORF g.236673 m.236673 type:complete len:62 (-) comp17102_c0_seq1:297-482(-)